MNGRSSMDSDIQKSAVQGATFLFWQKGAEVASYDEIVAVTGLSRKALYARWADKDALIRETLADYYDTWLAPMLAPIRGGGANGMIKFWDAFEEGAKQPNWRGCYLSRTASGPLRARDYVAEMFARYIEELQNVFSAEIIRGQTEGNVDGSIDPSTAAWQISGVVVLISTLGAQNGYDHRIENLLAVARKTSGL